jgi:hypothetical protein
MQGNWNWGNNTTPFSTLGGKQPACFALQEVGDNDFKLLRSFGYTSRNGKAMIPVTPHLLPGTDLASIPSFLGWFARRHGRHTPAALLHDELVTRNPEPLPGTARMTRAKADLLFREALVDSDVPLVKSWVLWTGVTLPTRWRSSAGAKIAFGHMVRRRPGRNRSACLWLVDHQPHPGDDCAARPSGLRGLVGPCLASGSCRRLRLLGGCLRIASGMARLPGLSRGRVRSPRTQTATAAEQGSSPPATGAIHQALKVQRQD